MLYYPKIPGSRNAPSGRCVAFEKLDGTNLHWVWDRDFGWHAFGTRRDEFDLTSNGIAEFNAAHPGLEQAPDVFLAALADGLERVFRENPGYAEAGTLTAFTEFGGPNSFAGTHRPADPKDVVLFDVMIGRDRLVGPWQFVADFDHLRTPRVLYEGPLTGRFLEAVREGKYGADEGAVCKGGAGGADVWMVKVKTYAYLKRLQATFGDRWQTYWE